MLSPVEERDLQDDHQIYWLVEAPNFLVISRHKVTAAAAQVEHSAPKDRVISQAIEESSQF